jgi:hypothetical protein
MTIGMASLAPLIDPRRSPSPKNQAPTSTFNFWKGISRSDQTGATFANSSTHGVDNLNKIRRSKAPLFWRSALRGDICHSLGRANRSAVGCLRHTRDSGALDSETGLLALRASPFSRLKGKNLVWALDLQGSAFPRTRVFVRDVGQLLGRALLFQVSDGPRVCASRLPFTVQRGARFSSGPLRLRRHAFLFSSGTFEDQRRRALHV